MRRNKHRYDTQNKLAESGPLLTNHLRDLDIELELLKRKREIIEQKQNILNRERYSAKRQFEFNNAPNEYNRQEPKPNQPYGSYMQHYEGSSNSGNYRSHGVKRQAEVQSHPWPSKRSNTSLNINPWQSGPNPVQTQPFMGKPAPLMAIKTSMPSPPKKFQPPPRRNFQPSKVSKSKPRPPPNNLGSFPVEKTKKLITEVMNTIDKKPDETQILRADRTPTLQVKGRLELALGMIMKQIKQNHCLEPGDLENFFTPFIQRLLKHTIRTRIHNLMMNQYVGAANDIVIIYRKKYPVETDIELIKVAKDAQSLSIPHLGVIQLIDEDDPEEFFKKNMTKILNSKIDEMLTKLERIYKSSGHNLDEIVDQLPEPNGEKQNEKKSEPVQFTIEEACSNETALAKISKNAEKLRYYTSFLDEMIAARLPKIIPRYKNLLLSIVFSEKEFIGTKAMITAQLKRKILKNIEKDESYMIHNKKIVSAQSEGTESGAKEKQSQSANSNAGSVLKPPTVISEQQDISEQETSKQETSKQQTPEQETSKQETPGEQEKSGQEISKIVPSVSNDDDENSPAIKDADKEKNDDTIDNIGTSAQVENEKSTESEGDKSNTLTTPATSTPMKKAATNVQTLASNDIHYVKLIGRPGLPARAVIYEFLNKFKPASIKKHKSIGNLLVIGFSDKENFEKILAANESVVGDSTIIIKASEQVNGNKLTPSVSKTSGTATADNSSNKLDTQNENNSVNNSNTLSESRLENDSFMILNSDIESQINDLLTSIRQSEDESDVNSKEDKIDDNIQEDKTNDNIQEECGNIGETEAVPSQSKTECTENKTSDEKVITENEKDKIELEATKETSEEKNKEIEKPEAKSKANVKETGRATPTRTSSRLAKMPSSVMTRRTSRLGQNN